MRRMVIDAMTAKYTLSREPPRSDAALVYPDQAQPGRWLVGPPRRSTGKEEAFTGPNACHAALEFAHRCYGSARFFAS